MKIAIVTEGDFSPKKGKNPLHDDKFLSEELAKKGHEVEIVDWQDKEIKWQQYDSIFVSSAWNIPQHTQEFEAWLDHCESDEKKRLINDREVIDSGIRKYGYLTVLKHTIGEDVSSDAGSITPTRFFSRQSGVGADHAVQLVTEAENLQTVLARIDQDPIFQDQDLVIKPITSADGHDTIIYHRSQRDIPVLKEEHMTSSLDKANDLFQKILADPKANGVMIQTYMQSIEKTGEYSLVFFNGEYSHAVHKKPGFRNSTSSKEREVVDELPKGMEAFAYNVLSKMNEKFGKEAITRARIDIIGGKERAADNLDFNWCVGEVELIEPNCNIACFRNEAEAHGKSGDLDKENFRLKQRDNIIANFANAIETRTLNLQKQKQPEQAFHATSGDSLSKKPSVSRGGDE